MSLAERMWFRHCFRHPESTGHLHRQALPVSWHLSQTGGCIQAALGDAGATHITAQYAKALDLNTMPKNKHFSQHVVGMLLNIHNE